MGIIKNGLLGPTTGSVANITAYILNGQNVIRTGKGIKRKKSSKAQKANEQRMTVVNAFLKPLKSVISVGYALEARGTTSNYHNKATSYHKKNALRGTYPEIVMDYEKVMISMGTLEPPQSPAIEVLKSGFRVSWQPTKDKNISDGDAQIMVLAYFPDKNRARYTLYGAQKKQGTETLDLAKTYHGLAAEIYIAFVAADRQSISNSVYMGTHVIDQTSVSKNIL